METQRGRGDRLNQGAEKMSSFETCNSGYSFSSKFILLSAKIVTAKKWRYEPWRIYVKCLCQSTHVWEVLRWLWLLHGLGTACKWGH